MSLVSGQIIKESEVAYLAVTMHGEGKFNPTSLAEFNSVLDELDQDTDIQCLIITGEGKNFSQGSDLAYLTSAPPEESAAFVDSCMLMIGRLLTSGVPVVSAVNGHAFGLGAMIMLASDYRVMREDRGYFCLPEVDLGMVLIPSMNALVKHKLSRRGVRDLLLAGARAGAVQLQAYEVVDECCLLEEVMEKAMAIAAPMIGKDRGTVSGLKRGVNEEVLVAIK